MGGSTLTRADLCEAIYNEVGLSRTESADIVETVLEHICKSLESGDNVKLSSFGTFTVRAKGGRIGRNPKTGEEVPITPRRVLVFRPSHVLRDEVNSRPVIDGSGPVIDGSGPVIDGSGPVIDGSG